MSTPDTSSSNSTSKPMPNGSSPITSFEDGVASIQQIFTQIVPDDAADQGIAGFLRQLEQADVIGRDMEGRIDAVLAYLDGILESFGEDGKVLEEGVAETPSQASGETQAEKGEN